jgi:pimeloyl-ACP methyl ester carboxylesterase
MARILRRLLTSLAISAGIFLVIAHVLALTQWPKPITDGDTLRFPSGTSQQTPITLDTFVARDGSILGYRDIPGIDDHAPLLVLIHGSGWYGVGYVDLARQISKLANYRVVVPDLRGHGLLADPRGDVAYIGQLEDDLRDFMDHLGAKSAVFAGHSSGGGLVVRLAGGTHGDMVKRAVLIAPFLKYNAPTTRVQAGGWAHTLTRRIIGLSMLNMVRLTHLNFLPVIQFNFTRSVLESDKGKHATTSYSHRMNTSFTPRMAYEQDIAKLPAFLLIVGANDEAFFADYYQKLMSEITDRGTYSVLPNLSHLDVLNDELAAQTIATFLATPQTA